MKKIKSQYTRFKDSVKHKIGASSGSHASASLPDLTQPTGSKNPVLREARRAVTPLPSAHASELPVSSSIHQTLPAPASLDFVASDDSVNSTGNVATSTQLQESSSTSFVPQNLAPISLAPTPHKGTSTAKWPGLEALLKTLGATAEIFPPFKAAIDTFGNLVEVFETAVAQSSGHNDLRTKLDSLLEDLSRHPNGLTSPRISMIMKNLCAGINAELQFVQQKSARDTLQTRLTADNPDQVLGCYQRIQSHLERLTLNANLSIWDTVDRLDKASLQNEHEARLRQLLAVPSAVYNSAASEEIQRRPCTDGTRREELTRLLDWARNRYGAQVYWMNGMAGTGKTTIAYSLCAELETTAELAASFFCSRQIPECRDVKLIIPAVAYQLARFSLSFCHALLNVLEAEPDVHTRVLRTQFEYLLVKPLSEVKPMLPTDLVVVIDALDECENENSVGQILDVLLSSQSTHGIPVRFLLSSRPEPQIYSRMRVKIGTDETARLVLHEVDGTKVKQDIKTYLENELEHVNLTSAQLAALVAHVGVLFIYASTVARYIKDGLLTEQHETRLNMILSLTSATKSDKDRDIDTLYMSILRAAFDSRYLDQPDKILMKTILDTIICAQEALTIAGLAGLLRLRDGRQIDGLLRPLRSVLNISETTEVVNTLHASFPDFMRDRERSGSFHCDDYSAHARIMRACLEVVRINDPQFNICRLKSSHLCDKDIPNLTKYADQAISSQLLYACRYWAVHMRLGEHGDDTARLVYRFLSGQLLLWMEVLNLKGYMHLGPGILQLVVGWSSTHRCPAETIDLAHDAWRFVTMFTGHAVSQSTSHIYVSMLPFWPESGSVAKNYMNRFQGAIRVKGSAMTRRQLALLTTWLLPGSVWSVCFSPDESLLACAVESSIFIVDGTTGRPVLGPLDHSDRVNGVVFSSDDARLISCSYDKTLKVWDTNNGQLVLELFTRHTDYVNCVSLFPDGKRVISGSRDGTVRVWSLETGSTVLGALRGQNRGVWSVCVSFSGTRIASGHGDGTIQVWDAEIGQLLLGPLSGHTATIESVCFSPDDTRLVSGSRDNKIRVWSRLTGQVHIDVLEGHTDEIYSVAFSADGKHIVSGSRDKTVRLWNVEGTPQLVRVLTGHTSAVWCVRFSSDGARIVSSSFDRTIRVWDARTQAPPDTPLQGHTQAVTSVVFSHDATRILSGSKDGTIYIWDTHTGQIAVGPMKGHTGWVRSVCFSPDQSRIASGSQDESVRLWDARSGEAVGKPLTGHTGRVLSVCFSPDGGVVASGSEDKAIRLWDAQSGEAVGSPLKKHKNWVRSVCFSPDGLRIVSGSDDRSVLVWDVNTRQPALPPLKGHTDQVWAVCISPDGTRIASGSGDKTVRFWDAHSGQGLFGPLSGHTAEVSSVCFSLDSLYVVSGSDDKTIRLWDAQSGQAVGSPLIGHADWVMSAAFSPNGERIVSGSADLSIRVCDIADLVQVKQSQGSDDNTTKPSHSRQSWDLQDDGWVVDADSRLLAWVPPDLHTSLMNPRNSLLISAQGAVELDIESAKLGESWSECYTP